MARSAAQHIQEPEAQEAEPTAETLVPEFPADFAFTVTDEIAVPVNAPRGGKAPTHPWIANFDNMGHNGSFFVPLSYWITKRGRTVDTTPFSWQKQTIATTFADWKKKGKPADGGDNPREKWRLTTVARELGQDPHHPDMVGVRCWKVDTTR